MKQPANKRDYTSNAKQLDNNDLDYVDDCIQSTLLEKHSLPNFLTISIFIFFTLFLLWAYLSEIDRVTIAEGKVIPSSQVQIIEELHDGIVKDILVQKGQIIDKDQILIELDATHPTADYRQTIAKLQALHATIARLQAQANNQPKVTYPQDIQQNRVDLMKREDALFEQRLSSLHSTLSILQKSYELATDELKIMRPLVKQGATSQVELLRIERQVNELEGQIADTKNEFHDQALSKINELKAEAEALEETLSSLKDRMRRTTIRSPVHGIVKKLNVHTLGAVIKSGMDIMEIVPLKDSLLIEGKVRPSDIGFIHPGQKASVKFTAYDFSIYGGLQGKVEYISADTIVDEEKKDQSYYLVTVRTTQNYLGISKNPLPIIPGMTTTIHILAGKRSILDYLLKPVLRARQYAFTEH